MPNHEMPVAMPARDTSTEVNFREQTHGYTSDDVTFDNSSAIIEAKPGESLDEYIEKFIEGSKQREAANNQSVHNSLVAATERRRKRHEEVADLSDIDP